MKECRGVAEALILQQLNDQIPPHSCLSVLTGMTMLFINMLFVIFVAAYFPEKEKQGIGADNQGCNDIYNFTDAGFPAFFKRIVIMQ